MANYNGQLKPNEIYASIFNMIINMRVFSNNIAGTYSDIVEMCRVDGSLYGDTKLYYSTDILKSYPWGNDAEAANLLKLYRPKDPDCQEITLDIFRQIPLTIDYYLTKRAWMNEGAFSEFNSVILANLTDTKKVYDASLINSFVGTEETSIGKQTQEITFTSVEGDLEATNRLESQYISEKLANIIIELKDFSRDYNDYKNLRSLNTDSIVLIWNSKFYNKILNIDLPTIFHKDGLLSKLEQKVLPSRFFGKINVSAGKTTELNSDVRSLLEKDYTVSGKTTHVFPGDLLPNSVNYAANETYTNDDTIICKIIHKESVPYMSGFQVNTSFFNPKSLTENHYLTFGHNTLVHLKNYPFITLRGKKA